MVNILLATRLWNAASEHRVAESRVYNTAQEIVSSKFLRQTKKTRRGIQYVGKNVFSILFLSVYESIGIPKERRLLYGSVNHVVRGLVTATDNILDDEFKELISLALPERAFRFKSVVHIMLFDRILQRLLAREVQQGTLPPILAREVDRQIFSAMLDIGRKEAEKEAGIHRILTPQNVIETVHRKIGGDLLDLAFIAPGLIETDLQHKVTKAARGVFAIGMALQKLDDLTDLYDDVYEKKHNYLVSLLHHEGTPAEKEILARDMQTREKAKKPLDVKYKRLTGRVTREAIAEALRGFDILHSAGFWMGQKTAKKLLRELFRLRNVGYLWEE